jgi:intein/homing endonuclease|tara:strand:- start:779 stop:1261 length:483 start_codon:yes stop_codon:yes gene_type:complete
MKIALADGTYKTLDDLEYLDKIQSWVMGDLPSEGNEADEWDSYKDWSTSDVLNFEFTSGWVSKKEYGSFDHYYKIILANGALLKVTQEEPCYVKRGSEYMWCRIDNLLESDQLLTNEREFIDISSIEIINETLEVIHINVEPNDIFFIEGILVHNGKGGK